MAIFAPGWTHEYFGSSTFRVLEDLFWAQLFPYLYVHVPIYEDETFRTTFCRGAGIDYYYNGEVRLILMKYLALFDISNKIISNFTKRVRLHLGVFRTASDGKTRDTQKGTILQSANAGTATFSSRAAFAIYAIHATDPYRGCRGYRRQ